MTAKVNQIKVLHSLPGRVRFRLPAPAVGSGTGAGTKDMVLDLEGVLWVRLNPACCSLAVGFSPDSLSTARILAALRAHMSRSGQVRIAPLACCSRGPAHKEGQEVSPVRGAALRFAGLSLVAGWAFLRGGVLKLTVRQTLFSPLGLAVAAATLPLLKKAKQDLESRRFGLDGFLAGSILAATAMGEAVTALEILWIDSGAELLSAWIAQRSRKAISEILRISGKNTFLVVDGQEIEVPVDRVPARGRGGPAHRGEGAGGRGHRRRPGPGRRIPPQRPVRVHAPDQRRPGPGRDPGPGGGGFRQGPPGGRPHLPGPDHPPGGGVPGEPGPPSSRRPTGWPYGCSSWGRP